jgi:hypothetical protein
VVVIFFGREIARRFGKSIYAKYRERERGRERERERERGRGRKLINPRGLIPHGIRS